MTEVYGRIKPSFLYREEERYGQTQLGTQGHSMRMSVWDSPPCVFVSYLRPSRHSYVWSGPPGGGGGCFLKLLMGLSTTV